MNIISLCWKIVIDKNFRDAVFLLLDIVKSSDIKGYSFIDANQNRDTILDFEIAKCKKEIDTLNSVLSHIKKYEPSNDNLIGSVNEVLNEIKLYYRTIE